MSVRGCQAEQRMSEGRLCVSRHVFQHEVQGKHHIWVTSDSIVCPVRDNNVGCAGSDVVEEPFAICGREDVLDGV